MIRIKDKTGLRRMVLEAEDTTGENDVIEIFNDGDWARTSPSTISPDAALRIPLCFFLDDRFGFGNTKKSKLITNNFRIFEDRMNGN